MADPWWAGGQIRREAAGGARAPNADCPWPPRPGVNRRHDAATIRSASSCFIITPRNRNRRWCPRRASLPASSRSRTGRCVPSSRWWPGGEAAGAGCCTRAWMVVEVAALAGHNNIVSTAKASTPPCLLPTPSSRAALRAGSSRRRYSMGDPRQGQGWSLIDGRAGLHEAGHAHQRCNRQRYSVPPPDPRLAAARGRFCMELRPSKSRQVTVTADPRLLARFDRSVAF